MHSTETEGMPVDGREAFHAVNRWRVCAASVRGTSHESGDVPCQDAHAWVELKDGTLLAAVADGAGSASHSHLGSGLAARVALDELQAEFAHDDLAAFDEEQWTALLGQVFEKVRLALEALALDLQQPVRELATTLTCAVVIENRLLVAQIGDGFGVARDGSGDLIPLNLPSRGEHANETAFITSSTALAELDVVVSTFEARSIALSTDGLLRLALRLPEHEPYGPFFLPVLQFVEDADVEADSEAMGAKLQAFLDSDRIRARTDDDKTLLIATRVAWRPESDSEEVSMEVGSKFPERTTAKAMEVLT